MNLSLWGIRNPAAAALTFVVLCIAGLYGLRKLPIATLPDFTLPEINVVITLRGATPDQLETEVTRKIEDAVATLADIKHITSTISDGSSRTRIQFVFGRNMDRALEDVRNAVDRIRVDLPGDIDEPSITRMNVVGGTLLSYAVVSNRLGQDELSWFVDDTVRKAIFQVQGVGQVSRIGGVDREVRVNIRPDALQSLGLTAGTVSAQLARLQVELPGGRTALGGKEQAVRTVATVHSAGELADFPIPLPDGRTVRLSAFARVTDSIAEPRALALLDGKPVVSVSIQRSKGASEVAVGRQVRGRIAALAAQYPDIRFVEVGSAVEPAENSYNASVTMLLEGAILAVIVVWIFLRDWHATWISAVALPLSVLPTFAMMYWSGLSLNLLSLLAFAVVIGILVDDAIVEVENIARHRAMGKSPEQAAIDAANEIGIAVIATSATLAAVFVPVAFIPGEIGLFFREFGWTAAAAVLFSLLVARLLTPMLAARFLVTEPRMEPQARWLTSYLSSVESALRHRGRTLIIAFGTFVLALALVPFIPTTFLPPGDAERADLVLELPPGATLADTRDAAERARALLNGIPEVQSVFTRVGAVTVQGYGGGFQDDIRKATLTVSFRKDRQRELPTLENDIRGKLRDIPGVRLSFAAQGPGNKFEMVLAGRDPAQLAGAARNLESAMRALPGLGSVTSSASLLQPEIVIVPDPARAADLGVSTFDIAEAARIATSGDLPQRLAKLNLAERQIPIRVQVADASLRDASLLSLLRVPARGGSVPLSAVATISDASSPAQIDRFDRDRNITISTELNGQPLGNVMAKLRKQPAYRNLPAGVRILSSGDAEALVDLFVGFGVSLLAGLASVYIVLLLLFGSATLPLVILAAVPLCGVGAFGALLVTGYALTLPSLIGLLMLTGVATKNSILIVDYAIIGERDHGMDRHAALIDACRKRVRPVIMTTMAMGAGMMPVALGLGADGNFRAPLGIAVIGGLLTSTFLSLLAVPAAYSLMAEKRDRWQERRRARAARREASSGIAS